MKACVTRESVCAADDAIARLPVYVDLPDESSLAALVEQVWTCASLPRMDGGRATWALVSRVPLAVAAQEWRRPGLVHAKQLGRVAVGSLDVRDGAAHFHWTYYAQTDPNLVLDILTRLRLALP
jgi:hypothetical protein